MQLVCVTVVARADSATQPHLAAGGECSSHRRSVARITVESLAVARPVLGRVAWRERCQGGTAMQA